ncbi:MAG: hypothetical protein LQ347_000808 [Umbilicaria vellea]|nr:MAG: hypothetical protein LQ347_000808 [Umbilicaria vellea]
MIVTRKTPVQVSLRQPAYVPSSSPCKDQSQSQSQSQRPRLFTTQNPGFGSRHVHDTAPFSLWDDESATFREPLTRELDWMFATYRARTIDVELPDIVIRTDQPPTEIPLTVGGALVRFVPEDMVLHNVPDGSLRPYPNRQRGDLLSSPLPLFSIPSHQQCHEIIRLLELEVDIRAIHFLPPQIIVELDIVGGKKYNRHSLPSRAGGISIQYHEANESFWKGSSQMGYERLITPTDTVVDNSDYLFNNPHRISPGVCLASSLVMEGGLPTSRWFSTSAGLFLQRGTKRYVSVANHGFPDSSEVYHPSPTGRRIGQITDRFPAWDLAFAQLDPSISFSNDHYFAAPKPSRLICVEEIKAGDWFEVDGYSTGRLDMCARGRSYVSPEMPAGIQVIPVPYRKWRIETAYSLFGSIGASVKEGICGAPVVDQEGRVAGMFSLVDQSGLWAHTAGLDFFSNSGWSLI